MFSFSMSMARGASPLSIPGDVSVRCAACTSSLFVSRQTRGCGAGNKGDTTAYDTAARDTRTCEAQTLADSICRSGHAPGACGCPERHVGVSDRASPGPTRQGHASRIPVPSGRPQSACSRRSCLIGYYGLSYLSHLAPCGPRLDTLMPGTVTTRHDNGTHPRRITRPGTIPCHWPARSLRETPVPFVWQQHTAARRAQPRPSLYQQTLAMSG